MMVMMMMMTMMRLTECRTCHAKGRGAEKYTSCTAHGESQHELGEILGLLRPENQASQSTAQIPEALVSRILKRHRTSHDPGLFPCQISRPLGRAQAPETVCSACSRHLGLRPKATWFPCILNIRRPFCCWPNQASRAYYKHYHSHLKSCITKHQKSSNENPRRPEP